MNSTDTMPLTHYDTWLRRVQEATAEHARTRRMLDAVIADATAAGVPPEALQAVGQCEPGHGRHASSETDVEPVEPAVDWNVH